MTLPATVAAAIERNAKNPRLVKVGDTTVEMPDIDQQIKADQYTKAAAAAAKNHYGLSF